MTAQPSAQIGFRRAIEARSVLLAELTAREMRHLTLEDALELVILYAEKGDAKFERQPAAGSVGWRSSGSG